MKRKLVGGAVSLVFMALALGPVSAGSANAAPTPAGTEISPGWFILGATVTGPGTTAPRTMDGGQAAAFIQSWLPAQLYGQLQQQLPPKGLLQYTVTVADTINGTPQKLIAYYVSDGHNAWVSMPIQDLGGGAIVNKIGWFLALPRAIDGFAGKLAPVPANNGPTVSTTTAGASGLPARTGAKSNSWAIPLGIAAAVVALAGLAYIAITRSARSANAT